MKDLQRAFGEFDHGSSSGSGRPRVELSDSSSSSLSMFGRTVLTGEVNKSGDASSTMSAEGDKGT